MRYHVHAVLVLDERRAVQVYFSPTRIGYAPFQTLSNSCPEASSARVWDFGFEPCRSLSQSSAPLRQSTLECGRRMDR